jgi:hypothetical protein
MVAAATVLLQLLIRHLLNATYAAQAFAEIHEGLTHRTALMLYKVLSTGAAQVSVALQ